MAEYVTIEEAYENLCNAVVYRAYQDLVIGLVRKYQEPCRGDPYILKQAVNFINDADRLSFFTDIDGRYLYRLAEKEAEEKIRKIEKEKMYLEYIKKVEEINNE